MNIKKIEKLIILGDVIVSFLLVLVFMWILLSKKNKNEFSKFNIDITQKQKNIKELKHPLIYYNYIWNTPYNPEAPPPPKTPKIPPNWHENFLKRYIKVKSILSDDFALVNIYNRDKLIEPLKETNKNDRNKPWELNIVGRRLIILKIDPYQGIKFKFPDGKIVWLKIKREKKKEKTPKKSFWKVKGNEWNVTINQANSILKNTDKYIEEIAPELQYNAQGQPIGVKIRRIKNFSLPYKFGLRENDIVLSINGTPLKSISPEFIKELIRRHRKDKVIRVKLMRDNRIIELIYNVVK